MKVVIIVPVLVTGGAEMMVARLAAAMDRSKVDIEVICLGSKQGSILERKIEDAGVFVHYIGKGMNMRLQAIKKVFCLLSSINPDVVHSHISAIGYALPWVLFHRKKLIHTIHTRPDAEFSRKLTTVLRIMTKLNKVILVAVSKENFALARSFYNANAKQIKCVNNPVETERYYRNKCRNDNHVVFINVSRQDVNKNQIMAVRAMASVIKEVPNARMVLIGDGNQHEQLIHERDILGLTKVIELPGESSEPEHFLANADIYISTSHREGLPLSMLEAMASGLPIISTNVGGVPDIVRDNGVLISDGDIEALTREMIHFATDRDWAEQCGRKSRIIAKEYDAKACADAYALIYSEAISSRKEKESCF